MPLKKAPLSPGRWRAGTVGQSVGRWGEPGGKAGVVGGLVLDTSESCIPFGHWGWGQGWNQGPSRLGPHPVVGGWASCPGVQTGSKPIFPDLPQAVRGAWGCREGPSLARAQSPAQRWRCQICVSCTFSLEPLLKSRGSWMELRPGGPFPPQPPPLGLLL